MYYAYLNPVTNFDDVDRWVEIVDWCLVKTPGWEWEFESEAENTVYSRRKIIFKSESDLMLYKLTWE